MFPIPIAIIPHYTDQANNKFYGKKRTKGMKFYENREVARKKRIEKRRARKKGK